MKRDANEQPIIKALEKVGASVQQLATAGVADLLVCYRRAVFLLEVKMPKGKLNEAQEEFRRKFPVAIAHTPEEALMAIGINVDEGAGF